MIGMRQVSMKEMGSGIRRMTRRAEAQIKFFSYLKQFNPLYDDDTRRMDMLLMAGGVVRGRQAGASWKLSQRLGHTVSVKTPMRYDVSLKPGKTKPQLYAFFSDITKGEPLPPLDGREMYGLVKAAEAGGLVTVRTSNWRANRFLAGVHNVETGWAKG